MVFRWLTSSLLKDSIKSKASYVIKNKVSSLTTIFLILMKSNWLYFKIELFIPKINERED